VWTGLIWMSVVGLMRTWAQKKSAIKWSGFLDLPLKKAYASWN
jgi:hypothetical protein